MPAGPARCARSRSGCARGRRSGQRLPAHALDVRAARPRHFARRRGAALDDRRAGSVPRLHDPCRADRERLRSRSVTSLDRKPKKYARFLGEELTLVYHGRLLVVMPNGFGVSRAGLALPAEQRILDRLPPPGSGGPRLVQAGIAGVRALAAAAGVRVPAPKPASGGGGSDTLVWASGGAAAAVLVAGAILFALRRRARASSQPTGMR